MRTKILLILVVAAGIFAGCSEKPQPINYGKDLCEYCKMTITDKNYSAEFITAKGKVYKFDSIGCLIDYLTDNNISPDKNSSLLITQFASRQKFIDAITAIYVLNDKFHSPMGLNVLAFADAEDSQAFIKANGGRVLSWQELIQLKKE